MAKVIYIHAMDSIRRTKKIGKSRIVKPTVLGKPGLVYWGIVRPVTRKENIFFKKPNGRTED